MTEVWLCGIRADFFFFFFSSRRRHTRLQGDWSSDVCSSDLAFWLMADSGGNMLLIWIAIVVPFGILYAAVYGPEAALFCDLFDAKVRYTGISFVYQFSGIFASGITPIIAKIGRAHV